MKTALINYKGASGKTTLATHLFAPRMEGAPIIAVESINQVANADGLDVEKVRGDQFRAIFKKLAMLDNAIIDVGASNVEDFLAGMTKFEESMAEIDLFVVPTTSGTNELRDAITLIDVLHDMGVPAEKIRVIFNRVDSDVAEEFGPLIAYVKKTGNCVISGNAAVMESELFDMIAPRKLTIAALVNDTSDYRTMARQATDDATRNKCLDMYTMRALAKSVNANLNEVFEAVTSLEVAA